MFMPRALSAITDGSNALSRISQVFLADTLDAELVVDPHLPEALVVKDASFKWEASREAIERLNAAEKLKSKGGRGGKGKGKGAVAGAATPLATLPDDYPPFGLEHVNLSIPRGGVIYAIVGPIGSGKSSLLQGLIGEMKMTGGEVLIGGRLAYCAQIPWIQNATMVRYTPCLFSLKGGLMRGALSEGQHHLWPCI